MPPPRNPPWKPPPPKRPPWKPPPPMPPPWPPPPPPPPRANAIVGAARPTDATASNAITVLRNITILRQRHSLPATTFGAGGNRFGKLLRASTSPLLDSPRATLINLNSKRE